MERDIERKLIAILKIVADSNEPLGARVISRKLDEEGIHLTERAVRFHLQLMDERNLTRAVGRQNRAGREITDKGREELRNALVSDKVGMVSSRMDELSYLTDFDLDTRQGNIILNVSMMRKDDFSEAMCIAKEAFDSNMCVGQLVLTADEGQVLGQLTIPKGMKALGTVCAVTINGILLHHRIPVKSRFGGILQMRDYQPLRFTEIIEYSASSLDPAEIFVKSKMTSVLNVARTGSGKVLAGFREIPIACLKEAESIFKRLEGIGLSGTVVIGEPNQPTIQMPVASGYAGLVVLAGLNPLAAVEEAGISTQNMSLCAMVDFQELKPLSLIC
jgi:HTH-type transcriptional regulator, global nitrogen regulator NrpRI